MLPRDPRDRDNLHYDPYAAVLIVGIFGILAICIAFLVFYHFFKGDL